MSVSVFAALALTLSAPLSAPAQEPPPQAAPAKEALAPAAVDPVEVSPKGVDPDRAFARRATPLSPSGKVLVWVEPLCPFVAGGRTEENRYIHARISQRARQAGMRMGAKGCKPNLTVVLADDPEDFIRRARRAGKMWVDRERPLSFDRYAKSDLPVRVWTNFSEVGVSRAASASEVLTNITDGSGSRVRTSVVGVVENQFVVVDRGQAQGRRLKGLADYVAMAGIASTRQTTDYAGHDTVLNLFAQDSDPGIEASRMDEAYLKGLQTVRPDAPGGSQIGHVVAQMRKAREQR